MTQSTIKEPTYRLGHSSFSADAERLQQILAWAHEKKARPTCLCSRAEPPMYVAKIGSGFFLKRMPGTGHLHEPSCPTFDPPPEVSGLGQVNGQAIVTDEAGETLLKLDFPLSVKGARATPVGDGGDEATSAEASPSKLRLLATLHYLWEAADLTKWRSAYGRRRSWWIVHRELQGVAARTKTKAGAMADTLFVPPVYSIEDKDRLAAERRRFMHRLLPAKGKPVPLGILVAELKGQQPSQYGRKLTFKHLPDFPLFMDEETGKRFDKIAGEKVEMVEAMPDTHLICIATFSTKGNYGNVREIAVMPVTGQWLPFDNEREHELVQALMDRDFVKCLKYNLKAGAPVANALLLDAESPVALFSPPADMPGEEEDELRAIAAEGVYPAWHWPAGEFEMPVLPERKGV
ncbi:DUF1173 family protein [Paracoccus simplex]|uniref:DUF1173 family protein n=1 Tax=Paracoccus simplex TaxID=2086346 RepID=A0ABV7S358_9RHOB